MPNVYPTLKNIKARISKESKCSLTRTNEILKKYFSITPSYVNILASRYGFREKRVLDIGSSYGQSLFFWGKGSEGVDVNEEAIAFTRSLGYTTYSCNIDNESLPKNKYEAIFTNNLYEHVVAPHLFLAKMFAALEDDGLLAIGYPLVPPMPIRLFWKILGITPWLAPEHINFYTIATAELFLNRSGFKVVSRFAPRPYEFHPLASNLVLPWYIHCFSICKKIPGFKYPAERLQEHDPQFCKDDLGCYR